MGLPRTNFGRQLKHPLQRPLDRLEAEGLIEYQRGRYWLTETGRRELAARVSGIR